MRGLCRVAVRFGLASTRPAANGKTGSRGTHPLSIAPGTASGCRIPPQPRHPWAAIAGYLPAAGHGMGLRRVAAE
eukprot:5259006-Alexandrium_andersonii.AAC.1